jgi:hypothetical protein
LRETRFVNRGRREDKHILQSRREREGRRREEKRRKGADRKSGGQYKTVADGSGQ